MKRIPPALWAVLLIGLFWGFFRFGIAPLTGLITGIAAPVPDSLVRMYTGMAVLAVLLFLSVNEERWQDVIQPVNTFLKDPLSLSLTIRWVRTGCLILAPVLAGCWALKKSSARPAPPADPPGIHFSLPGRYLGIKNPIPWTPEFIREGGVLYTRNCAVCHGDAQDGNGLFARAWQPKPANFRDSGTIAQLAENYLFWRIKEGGPGLPRGSIGYRSAMPAWDRVLEDQEIWKIIMFEYTSAGQKPARRDS